MTNRRDDRYMQGYQHDRRDERYLISTGQDGRQMGMQGGGYGQDRQMMGMGERAHDQMSQGRGMDMPQGGYAQQGGYGRDDMRERYDERSMRGGMGMSGSEAYGYGRDDRQMGSDSLHGSGMYQRNTGYRDDRSFAYGQSNLGMGTDRDMNPSRMSGRMGGGGGYSSHDGFYSSIGDDRQMGSQDGRQMGMQGGGYGMGGYGQDRQTGMSSMGGMGMSGISHRGKGPKGYQRSDDRIREMVSDALEDDHGIDASDIEVMVQNGEVTLTGTVTDRQQKRMAEDCAERVRGVRDVHNQIRVQQQGMSQMGSMGQSGGLQGSMTMGGQSSQGGMSTDNRHDDTGSNSTGVTSGVGTTTEPSTTTATTTGSHRS
ncbi:BON domain-containing protein [Deinococcus maricopensis]|uniref:Osmotically-inducible protein Y n=1 Tax=Deinococcus maricopensis (strain DSM 21211 / LMG 22137 / NRRL B-23946 / LB-34) TaxID=709986 RepID=E8UBH6_DEIML|nr:BON domain-containing protein [Deinococcus maricopensis]ADV68415.1 transport-associated protein [Deinococcus maricopensis DSM 21211]